MRYALCHPAIAAIAAALVIIVLAEGCGPPFEAVAERVAEAFSITDPAPIFPTPDEVVVDVPERAEPSRASYRDGGAP